MDNVLRTNESVSLTTSISLEKFTIEKKKDYLNYNFFSFNPLFFNSLLDFYFRKEKTMKKSNDDDDEKWNRF